MDPYHAKVVRESGTVEFAAPGARLHGGASGEDFSRDG